MASKKFFFSGQYRTRRQLCIIAFLMLLVPAIFMNACTPSRPAKRTSGPLIGFSLDSLVVERWRRDVDGFTKAAKDLGAEVILRVANQDANTQISQVRELLEQGIDVLVIIPNDAERLSDVCREARRRGVKVMSYDRLVHKANCDLYISFDNEKVGMLQAQAAVAAVPSGDYVIVNGAISDNNAFMINAGFHKVLDPLIAEGRIRLKAEIWPNDWMSDEVRSRFEMTVRPGEHIDAVLCGNDMLAETVISVLSENRLAGSAVVTGQDAELSACQRIAEGSQLATVYKPIESLALKAAAFAVMMARKEKIPAESVIDDGRYRVPYIKLEPILVTAETLESTVIKDGFHRAEDVYRNVKKR